MLGVIRSALPLLLAALAAAQTDDPALLRQRAGALAGQGKYEQAAMLLNLAIASLKKPLARKTSASPRRSVNWALSIARRIAWLMPSRSMSAHSPSA